MLYQAELSDARYFRLLRSSVPHRLPDISHSQCHATTTEIMATPETLVAPEVADYATEPADRPSGEAPIADDTNADISHSDVPALKENPTIRTETPAETHQDEPATTDQIPPKLNPSATEFISRSSSTGPGAEGVAPQKTNTLGQSRHAGARGGQPRRGRQSVANSRPVGNPTNGSPAAAGNPVVLADPVGEGVVDVAGMTGFKAGRAVREPRPPRGYVPPAPERKVCLVLLHWTCADAICILDAFDC